MQMAKKEEVLELLATEDPMEAGLVISFVKDVPPEDDRFQRHFGDGKAALGFWLEEMEKSEGKFLLQKCECRTVGSAGKGMATP